MLELADRLLPLLRDGVPVAVATCIDVVGSAPHGAGTSMALPLGGSPIGAVSGGCVEAAALADCRAVLAGGPAVVRRFGFGDAAAADAGLSCGGEVDVLTVLVRAREAAVLLPQLERVLRGEPASVALVTAGPAASVGALGTAEGIPGAPDLPAGALRALVEGVADSGRSGARDLECGPHRLRLLVEVSGRAPRLLLIGATETAVALAAAAAALGREVVVCDVRADFAAPARFPGARAVVTARPHDAVAAFAATGADAVCLLSHDEDLDALALAAALESSAGYVGALGSRSTTARRLARLRGMGVPEAALHRLHAPIGLDVGARTPAETAISILAELLAVRAASAAAPLRLGAGPIHRPAAQPA